MKLRQRTRRTEDGIVHLPKVIFPVNPLAGPVVVDVTYEGESYTMHIGGVAPLGSKQVHEFGTVTVANLRILLRLLYRRSFDSNEVPVYLAELLTRGEHLPARIDNGTAYERLRRSIERLTKVWIHVYRAGSDQPESEQLLTFKGSFGGKKKGGEKIANLVFAPSFWKACVTWADCWPVRADALEHMTSDLAAGAYMMLAPNTYAKRPGDLMRKDAVTVLRELNVAVPEHASHIRYAFERTRASGPGAKTVLQQMNGAPVGEGIFRVMPELEVNSSGTGFNIVYWREEAPTPADRMANADDRGVLEKLWVTEIGLPIEKFITSQIREDRTILPYEMETMAGFGYQLGPHRHYVETVRSFIGIRRFHAVLHGVKATAASGRPIGDIGRYFGAALRCEFVDWGKAFAKSLDSRRQ